MDRQEAKKAIQPNRYKDVGNNIQGTDDKITEEVSHYATSLTRISDVLNMTGIDFKA